MAFGALVRRRPFNPRPCFSLHKRRPFSSSGDHPKQRDSGHIPAGFEVDLSYPSYMVWGSNTGVGKTLVSAGLATSIICSSTATDAPPNVHYIKPVQTGFPQDSDSRFVSRKVSDIFKHRRPANNLYVSNQMLKVSPVAWHCLPGSKGADEIRKRDLGLDESGMVNINSYEGRALQGFDKDRGSADSELVCKTIYSWEEAVSPHLAAAREGCVVEDCSLVESLQKCQGGFNGKTDNNWSIIETAGGVASPGPSGTLQCDLYRPFRLPSILVGDGRLGGISGTISAYESLCLRGYDINAVILADNSLLNEKSLSTYLHDRIPVLVLPKIPEDASDSLMEWFSESYKVFSELKEILQASFLERKQRLHEMPKKAGRLLWWPFTQHSLVPEQSITLIDSRYGENFAVHKVQSEKYAKDCIVQQFDACASWWTQGPSAILQAELAREVGYTAGRFGHVMYPENVYEPALNCAELLLQGVGKGWATRVLFSDNGSTAIEIALKMAFRKFASDHGFLPECSERDSGKNFPEFKVLALRGSYHGDTLGAMEAQAPSPYTGFLQQPWYSGRGLFLDPPTVFYNKEKWNLHVPDALAYAELKNSGAEEWCYEAIFSTKRDDTCLAILYRDYISQQLSQFSTSYLSVHIAALITEPVIHAAGGMHMIDPLFQRVLVKECQTRGMPVIFDEVFTGFWRLGAESAAELLGCMPDIACYAKLLTGGVVPLAATLATNSVFEAFEGKSKLFALLHGHSYSGYAVGCAAAVKAMQWFKDPQLNLNISSNGNRLIELWDNKLVSKISAKSAVSRVVALGTVCAIELKADNADIGYGSLLASSIVQKLRNDGVYMRPLGNVIYLMCGPITPATVCSTILDKVCQRLDEC